MCFCSRLVDSVWNIYWVDFIVDVFDCVVLLRRVVPRWTHLFVFCVELLSRCEVDFYGFVLKRKTFGLCGDLKIVVLLQMVSFVFV